LPFLKIAAHKDYSFYRKKYETPPDFKSLHSFQKIYFFLIEHYDMVKDAFEKKQGFFKKNENNLLTNILLIWPFTYAKCIECSETLSNVQ